MFIEVKFPKATDNRNKQQDCKELKYATQSKKNIGTDADLEPRLVL